jgi:insertion element IS1 protein InsB
VRNGRKKNGRQNLLCKICKKQFQPAYVYQGCVREKKELVLKMLCRGSGVRDCAAVSGMSKSTVLAFIKTAAAKLVCKPKKHAYCRVQIDEQWSYVGRKERKVWMLYAYAVDEDEIIAFTMGKRSVWAVKNLWIKLKALDIDVFMTDDWEAFRAVLPKAKHLVGKVFTKAIEGLNTFFRTRSRRLVRRTVCFSKKLIYHYAMMKIIICHRNQRSSYI